MGSIPTVLINRDGMQVRINRLDYIEGQHQLWEENKKEPKEESKKEVVVDDPAPKTKVAQKRIRKQIED